MTDTLADIRASLLQAWTSDVHGADLSRTERVHLEELWHEIRRVEQVHAWLALSALSGQLLEALVRRRVRTLPGGPGGKVTTMYPAADAWRKHVAKTSGNTIVVASSVVSAVQLRNWASHGDLTYRGPSPRRATQSVALLLCLREAVYPRPRWELLDEDKSAVHTRPVEWWLDNYSTVHPGIVNDWLAQYGLRAALPQLLASGNAQSVLGHVLAYARASQA